MEPKGIMNKMSKDRTQRHTEKMQDQFREKKNVVLKQDISQVYNLR